MTTYTNFVFFNFISQPKKKTGGTGKKKTKRTQSQEHITKSQIDDSKPHAEVEEETPQVFKSSFSKT